LIARTVYANQALKAALAETFWGDGVAMTIPVHTVDSFQGCETDIVLLSMVRYGRTSPRSPMLCRFLPHAVQQMTEQRCGTCRANQREAVGFLKDYRRLNVALTRGRYSVIVVGNGNTISWYGLRTLQGSWPAS
jgi:superfamily I DNA and/or RNA helicase